MKMPVGIVENSVRKGIDPKSMVRLIFNGNFNWNPANNHILESLQGVMEIKLREIMREEMSSTYAYCKLQFAENEFSITKVPAPQLMYFLISV